MAQLVIRNLDPKIKENLKKRSERNHTSMEAEARRILAEALKDDVLPRAGLGSRIAGRFAQKGLDGPLPEWHGERIEAMEIE